METRATSEEHYVSRLQAAAAPSGLGRWWLVAPVGDSGVRGLLECVLSGELSAVRGPGPSAAAAGLKLCANEYVRPAGPLPVGFHELRWKLFFLRTLALYAARIAAVASFACVLYELTDAMLGGRLYERCEEVGVPMSRRTWGKDGDRGEAEGEGGPDSQLS